MLARPALSNPKSKKKMRKLMRTNLRAMRDALHIIPCKSRAQQCPNKHQLESWRRTDAQEGKVATRVSRCAATCAVSCTATCTSLHSHLHSHLRTKSAQPAVQPVDACKQPAAQTVAWPAV